MPQAYPACSLTPTAPYRNPTTALGDGLAMVGLGIGVRQERGAQRAGQGLVGEPDGHDPAQAAGTRTEPSASLPIARGTMADATAAALPPDDPPAVLPTDHGLQVCR
jgi:hypothetical protein